MTYPFGEEAVVTGVQSGERVVVDGRQNVRPGATVVERASTESAGVRRRAVPASGVAPGGAGLPREAGAASATAALGMSSGAAP